jgi:hypothetical protein
MAYLLAPMGQQPVMMAPQQGMMMQGQPQLHGLSGFQNGKQTSQTANNFAIPEILRQDHRSGKPF